MIYLTFILILFLIYLAFGLYIGYDIVHSHRQPIIKTPTDYQMEFEDIEFKSTDGLNIKGWLIPGKNKKLAIITHAYPFNRAGFDPKHQGFLTRFKENVDLLKMAKVLNDHGFWVLMFDFRNHGQSEKGKSAIGQNEYQDVLGALNFVDGDDRLNKMPIGFVSFCMGANSTIIAQSKNPVKFEKVRAIVAIQPIAQLVFLQIYITKTFSILALALLPIIDLGCRIFGNCPLYKMSPANYFKDIKLPTMLIQAKSDPWTDLDLIQKYFNEIRSPKEFWLIEKFMPRFEAYNYVSKKPERIIKFFEKYVS